MIAQVETPLSQQSKRVRQHGEFELVAAVIDQARKDIELAKRPPMKPTLVGRRKDCGYRNKWRSTQADQAKSWIRAMPARPLRPWSFVWCCEILGIEPVKLRAQMLANSRKPAPSDARGRNPNRGNVRCKS